MPLHYNHWPPRHAPISALPLPRFYPFACIVLIEQAVLHRHPMSLDIIPHEPAHDLGRCHILRPTNVHELAPQSFFDPDLECNVLPGHDFECTPWVPLCAPGKNSFFVSAICRQRPSPCRSGPEHDGRIQSGPCSGCLCLWTCAAASRRTPWRLRAVKLVAQLSHEFTAVKAALTVEHKDVELATLFTNL